jgi:hypothetical protein
MTKRLLLLGLREVDIVNGLDENILSSTIIGRTCHKQRNETCPPTYYRSFNGQCNNVKHSNWGAAFQPLARFAPVAYSDAVSQPRESKTGAHLPNERRLSLDLFQSPNEPHSQVTQITSYWLYLISNDIRYIF